MKRILITLALATMTLAGCTDDGPERSQDNVAVICTNYGALEIELFGEKAPNTAANFAAHAKSGYYDGVVFHRIIPDFMMQGGDPTGTGRGGETADGKTLKDEFHQDLRHDQPGILSMANSGPDSGSSQFFVTFVPTPHLDDKHAIFGQVTSGMDVMEEIEKVGSPQHGIPKEDVYMQTVLVGAGADACPAAAGPVADPGPFTCPFEGRQGLDGDLTADAITPGIFCITRQQDQVLVWAENHGEATVTVAWSLSGAGGGPLPDGWSATFDDPSQEVGAGKMVHTFLRVDVPEDAQGAVGLELHTGASTTPLTAHADLQHDLLTGTEDRVLLSYEGSCARNGEVFDEGSFGTTLASRQTVTGFDLGLIGMGEQETATIVVPAAIGYGESGPVCAGDDADLVFEVTITQRALRHASELA